MSVDLAQFHEVFFDEAGEHLAALESGLVELPLDAPDAEALNAIFRAAHSMKGGAGTFGFTDIAELTHILESLLDQVRKGQRPLTREIIDISLEAGDVLRQMVQMHRAGETGSVECADLQRRLTVLEQHIDPAEVPSSAPAVATPATSDEPCAYRLTLRFPDPQSLAEWPELRTRLTGLGTLQQDSEPALGEFQATLTSPVNLDELCESIAFVLAPERFLLEATDTSAAVSPDDDGAWGLFDASPAETESDGAWGLFTPPAPASPPPQQDAGDGSWGLFDAPAASPASPPPATPAPPSTRASPAVPKAAVADTSIRVSVEKVDQLINLVGELVITQSMLAQSVGAIDLQHDEALQRGIAQLERNTRELQESAMSIRMMPIGSVFSRFPRIVRDLAGKLGKEVKLLTFGEDTELDRGLIEKLADPLTHLVRNSLDHGIEAPATRTAAGKPASGTISLRASHQGGNIVIQVSDDGGGLRRDRILAKARSNGLAASDAMSDGEVWQLIFEPGFSTAEEVTDISGRGVGMDVVRRNIQSMGGRIEIESQAGIGTSITTRLPLTLAILDAMIVAVGQETYVIPLGYIVESLQPQEDQLETVAGSRTLVRVRGEYVPVLALREHFGVDGEGRSLTDTLMIVLEASSGKVALVVDDLLGQQQVVIKSLENNYRRVDCVSGATIMGDGHVALILDVEALARKAQQ
ncbi:chemotaxis protein CheA [Chitinibacteraceae bacterium HSL-7]